MFIAALQILVVGLGSAAVLAFLLSNLRYRKLELLADEEASTRPKISPSALVIRLLADLRKEEILLCRIQTPNPADCLKIRKLLNTNCRENDVHAAVENGVVVSRFDCPLDHAEKLGKRIISLLKQNGFTEGSCLIWEPELDTEGLMTWILGGDQHQPVGPMRLGVRVSESDSPTPEKEASSPSIDPVTGVFREDRISRALRRRLAEHNRMKEPVTLMRIRIQRSDSGEERDRILKQAADLLMSGCRESDLIGRSGESEFVLLAAGKMEQMESAARRMAQSLQQAGTRADFGLAALPEHGDSPGQLFDRAGRALGKISTPDGESVVWFDSSMEAQPDTGERGRFLKEEF